MRNSELLLIHLEIDSEEKLINIFRTFSIQSNQIMRGLLDSSVELIFQIGKIEGILKKSRYKNILVEGLSISCSSEIIIDDVSCIIKKETNSLIVEFFFDFKSFNKAISQEKFQTFKRFIIDLANLCHTIFSLDPADDTEGHILLNGTVGPAFDLFETSLI